MGGTFLSGHLQNGFELIKTQKETPTISITSLEWRVRNY